MEQEAKDTVQAGELSEFDRWRRTVGLVLGPVLALLVFVAPFDGLSVEAHRLAAVTTLVIVFWVSEAIPLPVTALLAVTLIIVLGISPADLVLDAFGDQVIFLFIGSFILARAMQIHGVDRRIAYALLAHPWVGQSSYRTIWTFGLTAWFLSMWISNTATVAMLFPVALAIARTSSMTGSNGDASTNRRRYATGLLLMLAYAGSMGGLATPVGTPPNLIGIALIEEGTGVRLGFLDWMTFGLPLSAMFLVLAYGVVMLLYRPARVAGLPQIEHVRGARAELGRWSSGERNSLVAFGVAVTLWILPGAVGLLLGSEHQWAELLSERLPEGIVALLAATLLFLLPTNWNQREFTLGWEDAVRIDWGTVLLFGGGIALGSTLFETGLARHIGSGLINALGVQSEPALSAVGITIASIISETSSNTASVNIVLPTLLAAIGPLDASALVVGVATTLGASMGFMLPVSTPPNAIIYGSGEVRLLDMVRAGILLDLVGILLLSLAAFWFLPLVLNTIVGGG